MSGAWVLIILVTVSSIPVVAIYFWFRAEKLQISLARFMFALLAGAAAFFPALIIQELLLFSTVTHGRMALFYEFFVRIALSEELSRLLMLFIFFWISARLKPGEQQGAAIGLVAGLGFAILESAALSASDIGIKIVLLRFFTAALHGACGSRIGSAAVLFRTNPIQALMRIVTATAIHGVYNLLVIQPGIQPLIAILIALSALTTAILTIRRVDKTGETT